MKAEAIGGGDDGPGSVSWLRGLDKQHSSHADVAGRHDPTKQINPSSPLSPNPDALFA